MQRLDRDAIEVAELQEEVTRARAVVIKAKACTAQAERIA
jgi:hypothetical protein